MGDPYNITDSTIPDRNSLTNNTFVTFPDLDASPTKAFMLENRKDPRYSKMFDLGFSKRPEEELYVVADDPYQVKNVAYDKKYKDIKSELLDQLMTVLHDANDPRVTEEVVPFEHPPFVEVPKDRK